MIRCLYYREPPHTLATKCPANNDLFSTFRNKFQRKCSAQSVSATDYGGFSR